MSDPSVIEWLKGKISEAESHLRYRENSELSWRDGDEASWKAAARLSGAKPMSKQERLQEAERAARIAVKCRREVEMFKAVLATVERGEA
jgi:hypothetical protein